MEGEEVEHLDPAEEKGGPEVDVPDVYEEGPVVLSREYKIIVTVSRTVPVIYADLLLSWPQVQV